LEKEMKRTIAVCTTALLIFGVWFGWQRYIEHKHALEQRQREMFEGYERCVAPLNEALGRPGPVSQEDIAIDQKARAACRDFWFRNTP
jgi:hypothetical protein